MDAYVFDHVRSPRGRGRPDGALSTVPPVELASQVLRALRERTTNGSDALPIDDVVLGCVMPVAEQGANLGRLAALMAGYPEDVPGQQLNRFCGSGLEAVNNAAAQVSSGQSHFVVAGGVESMSRVGLFADGGAWFTDPAVAFQIHYVPQGIGADAIATFCGMTRNDVDDFAAESQKRAAEAWQGGRFTRSVTPVRDLNGQILLERDEIVRPGTTRESLGKLAPSFADLGTKGFDEVAILRYPQLEALRHVHHAGNSSGIVDGAAFVLVGNKESGKRHGLKPRARIRSFASVGSEPSIMLSGPALAAERALKKAGMTVADIDLHEVNEAFAAVVMLYMGVLDVDHERVNVNGGAIAMGHPLGATGGILTGILVDELERRDLNAGMIAICEGAGMATATIIERI